MKKTFWTVSAAVFFAFVCSIPPASGGDVIWNPTINLSATGATNPQVTMDETGHAIAVWMRHDFVEAAASSDYGASWSEPSSLGYFPLAYGNPQVTMDETGHALVVWDSNFGPMSTITSAASSDYGVSWSEPVILGEGSNVPSPGADHKVTMDETGHAVAVWRWSVNIMASASSDYGVSWSEPLSLGYTPSAYGNPQVTMDETGHAVVVWDDIFGAVTITSSASSDYGVSWSEPVILGEDPKLPSLGADHKVTMDETGHAVAVWRGWDGALKLRIQESHSSDYGVNWSEPVDLSIPIYTELTRGNPQVTMDETGHAVAVWANWDGILSSASSDYGVSWLKTYGIVYYGHRNTARLQLTMDETGHALAVWQSIDWDRYLEESRIFSAVSADYGVSWSRWRVPSAAGATNPQVTMDEKGHAVVVWQRDRIIQSRSVADTDADGIGALIDNCPDMANADQTDSDGDGMGDVCDPQPLVFNVADPLGDGDGGCFIGTAGRSLGW